MYFCLFIPQSNFGQCLNYSIFFGLVSSLQFLASFYQTSITSSYSRMCALTSLLQLDSSEWVFCAHLATMSLPVLFLVQGMPPLLQSILFLSIVHILTIKSYLISPGSNFLPSPFLPSCFPSHMYICMSLKSFWIYSLFCCTVWSLSCKCFIIVTLYEKVLLVSVGCMCLVLSHVQLFVTPWTAARQALLSMGILQARLLEWVAMPFSRESS